MKIQELIDSLESLKLTHGNLPIAVRDPNDRAGEYIKIASSLSVEEGLIESVVVIL